MYEKRWAFSIPLEGIPLIEHAEIACEAERLGYRDAWSLEVDGLDCFAPLAAVAGATNLRLGTAIANVFTRGPATLAMSAAGLAELAPGRFVLGIGAGSQPIVEMWNGGRYKKPATRVREMVAFLRPALAGERVTFTGKTFSVDGFRLTRPPSQPVPIHVAALRENMLRVAGEVADGVCINWLSPDDVRKSVAVVREAARAAGRDPGAIEVSARIMVWADDPGPEADTGARRYINAYLNVPVYRAFHEWLGRGESLRPMWDAWAAGDRRGAVSAIPATVVDDLVVRGTAVERVAQVKRYMEAGVDTAFLHLLTHETDEARKAEVVLRALREMAPGAG
jgi:probable F420-dependent oxidoreductase